MNKYIIKLALAMLVVFTVSCDDYLDVNKDPDVLGDIDSPKRILPITQVGIANQLMAYDFGFGGAYWAQYWTQSYTASQFKNLCEFEETEFEDAYEELTAGVLNDLKRIKDLSTEEENKGYAYIAEALSIFTWQVVTDMWGDVPYSEALKGNEGIFHPEFDTGEVIYADLMTRVNALLNTDLTDVTIEEDFDFVFAGNMSYWESFVASLKLKLMMRQSETSGYDNAAVISFIESGVTFLSSSAKIDGNVWDDTREGKRHPMREFQEGGANYVSQNVLGSKSFIDYLDSNNDPRLDVLFTAPDGGHQGAFFGDFDSKEDSSGNGTADDDEEYSEALFTADMDLMIISEWEVNFYLAEAYARASNDANAKMYFDKGVTASLAQNGITATDIIDTGYAVWTSGTVEENIKQIAMQKWVANANYQFVESFFERNRTKYPAVDDIDIKLDREQAFLVLTAKGNEGDITISVAGRDKTNGKLPASAVYPAAVLNRNINAPSQKTDLLQKVWWDKKAGI